MTKPIGNRPSSSVHDASWKEEIQDAVHDVVEKAHDAFERIQKNLYSNIEHRPGRLDVSHRTA